MQKEVVPKISHKVGLFSKINCWWLQTSGGARTLETASRQLMYIMIITQPRVLKLQRCVRIQAMQETECCRSLLLYLPFVHKCMIFPWRVLLIKHTYKQIRLPNAFSYSTSCKRSLRLHLLAAGAVHLEVPFGGRLVGAMTVPSSTFQLNVRRITKCLICLVHILCFWSIKEGGGGFCTLGRVADFGHKGYSVFWILWKVKLFGR